MTAIDRIKGRGRIPRAALYARFSSDNQREESIEAQISAVARAESLLSNFGFLISLISFRYFILRIKKAVGFANAYCLNLYKPLSRIFFK